MNTKRQRLDTLLVERGLVESRAQAQRLIYAGEVLVAGQVISKPGQEVEIAANITLKAKPKFVSRGGDKLEYALSFFGVDVAGKICLDAGASTGGFTDCLLQRGAKKVYAVDVGKGQIHSKLAGDKRVCVFDETNARYLRADMFRERPELVVIDVSFISLTKVLPAVINVVASGGMIIALIKPQFEAERHESKRGVIKNPEVHHQVLEKIKKFGDKEPGLTFKGECVSPLKGPAGNIEFFICWTKT